MKRIFHVLVMALVLSLIACKERTDALPVIAVSVEPQRFLLEQLAGSHFKVITLMKPGSNPETFEPTMNTRAALDGAGAYLYVGGLPFENTLVESSPGLMTFCVAEGIEPLYGTHSPHDHDGGCEAHTHGSRNDESDPHVWTSVKNAMVMADNMADVLVRIDPAHSEEYRTRLEKLHQRLDSLDTAIASRLEKAGKTSFMVWHPSLGYFARDYGLEQISVGWEAKEPSAAALRRAVDKARENGVDVFFYQREFDSRQTQALTSQLGLHTVTIDPLSYDWFDQMNLITDELVRK